MKEEELFHFEKLILYQKALDYIDFVYEVTKNFPAEEIYGMRGQWRRASCSAALNTAEGTGGTKKEFANFLRISKRSIRECVVCTTVSARRGYISKENERFSRVKLIELSKMNSGLKRSLQRPKSLPGDLHTKTPNSQLPT